MGDNTLSLFEKAKRIAFESLNSLFASIKASAGKSPKVQ
jgi:hypothetical protein